MDHSFVSANKLRGNKWGKDSLNQQVLIVIVVHDIFVFIRFGFITGCKIEN